MRFSVLLLLCCCLPTPLPAQTSANPAEEQAIRAVLARFYEGWNEHDAEKMVSVYADDVDHVNVFAEWHKGKVAIEEDLRRLHAGRKNRSDGSSAPAGQKTYTIEKIRFIKPDVAVVHVRSLSTVGNLGTYVMTKDSGQWLVVSFTNVNYELRPTTPASDTAGRPGGGG